jgi:hypothetical protein
MITLLTTSWGNLPTNSTNSPTVRSWNRWNPTFPVVHTHFNRGDYWAQEKTYSERFDTQTQSEYILYKVDLLRQTTALIDTEFTIMADFNDVYTMGTVDHLPSLFDLDRAVVFSSERNRYPKNPSKGYEYSSFDVSHQWFLNSGVILAKTSMLKELLDKSMEVFVKSEKRIVGGDQGLFTQYYNSGVQPLIQLDYANLVSLSTYDSNFEDYYAKNNRIYSKRFNTSPVFIHLNGINYGGRNFIEYFKIETV